MAEYIDRYALTKNLCKAICGRDAGLCVAEPKDCYQEGMRAVFEISAADVAPVVHGRWIPSDMGGGEPDEAYICSVCGNPWFLVFGTPDENNMNYCLNCGARMDKEDNDGLDTP